MTTFLLCAGSVNEVSPTLVWTGPVRGMMPRDASRGGMSSKAKGREVAHTSAPGKSTHLALGDTG
jgi:hypothetical protein